MFLGVSHSMEQVNAVQEDGSIVTPQGWVPSSPRFYLQAGACPTTGPALRPHQLYNLLCWFKNTARCRKLSQSWLLRAVTSELCSS